MKKENCENCAKNDVLDCCLENGKVIAACLAGIGSLVCTVLSVVQFFHKDRHVIDAAVKKKGKGYSAVYISDDDGGLRKKCISVAVFLIGSTIGFIGAECFRTAVKNAEAVLAEDEEL